MEFTKTKRGKPLLIFDGYTLIKEADGSNGKVIYRCTEYTSNKCLGRCHSDSKSITLHSDNHNHAPSHAKIGTIRRVRRNNCTNFNPSCLEDLEIPEEFQITDQGDQFVCYDSGMLDNRERVIIFATNENINILKKCSQWYSDGTFKTSPPLFNQLFIVHGKINDATLLPLVYCLMTHRSQKSYSLVFNFLVDKLDGYEPQSMMSDFELAPRNAFSQAFSSTIQRVSEEWDKTNNGCEGFNPGFSTLLSAHHPSMWKFINGLKAQQKLTQMSIQKILAGEPQPPRKRHKYLTLAEKLENVTDDYGNRSTEEFVKGIFEKLHPQRVAYQFECMFDAESNANGFDLRAPRDLAVTVGAKYGLFVMSHINSNLCAICGHCSHRKLKVFVTGSDWGNYGFGLPPYHVLLMRIFL
ncbi:hypothetical protein Fcan01_28022 [Folsomia candida]|uniref:MULE transposase domain-containing protein n=1 Tax=Folsomia candida TaxID=158441 RepID=A0A226CUZ5_FOLCA|nr:hypothetical protein Fcan01_28022 [Folsomia candida]